MENKMKNKKNKVLMGLVAIILVGLVAFVAVAYRGNPSVKGPNYSADVESQLQSAIEAGDYEAWLKIRQDNNLPMNGRMFRVINEENFHLYRGLHDANTAGDLAKADSIRAELGLGQGMMRHNGGQGNMAGSGAGKSFADANNDGLCDSCGRARE